VAAGLGAGALTITIPSLLGVKEIGCGTRSCLRFRCWRLAPSRNRHDGDGTAPKLLADVGPLAAVGPSAFKDNRNLSLTALAPTTIKDHLSVRVVCELRSEKIVQCPMSQRYDEQVTGHLGLIP
jgi:hypothetical protein